MILTITLPGARDALTVRIKRADDYMDTVAFQPREPLAWDNLVRLADEAGVGRVFAGRRRLVYATGEVAVAALDHVEGLQWAIETDREGSPAVLVVDRPTEASLTLIVDRLILSEGATRLAVRRACGGRIESVELPPGTHWYILAGDSALAMSSDLTTITILGQVFRYASGGHRACEYCDLCSDEGCTIPDWVDLPCRAGGRYYLYSGEEESRD